MPCLTTSRVAIPGPQGIPGVSPAAPADGINAFTLVAADFVIPPLLGSVQITVVSNAWIGIDQLVYIETGGTFKATAKTGTTLVTIQNLADGLGSYETNVAPGTTVLAGTQVSPTGPQGAVPPINAYGLLGSAIVDMNTTADQAFNVRAGSYYIDKIVVIDASVSLTTAAGGIYTAAGKAGVSLVAATQVYTALTTSAKVLELSLAVPTDKRTEGTLYFSLTTAQGVAATAEVLVFGYVLT